MSPIDDGNSELPEGWALASLHDGLIDDVQPGFACGAHSRGGTGTVPHLRPMNVTVDGKIDLADLKSVPALEVDRDARWLRSGDVLFNNTNSPPLVGKTAFYGDTTPRAFSNHMTRLRCRRDSLDPQFCAHALHSRWQAGYFESICNNHVSQASISRSVLLNTKIALPPLAEQRRIVAKVEELLASVTATRERIARVPVILKKFRDAILAAACDGRLTAEWRESHIPTRTVEKVVQDLRSAHEKLAVNKARTRKGANSSRNSKNGCEVDAGLLPEIPDSWQYVRADEVVEPGTVVTYGIVLPGPQVADGVPYVRGLDIEGGRVKVDQLWRTSAAIAGKHERSRLEPGDVLLCIIRHLKVAIVPQSLRGGNLTQGTVRMRPSDAILGAYLALCLESPNVQDWMKTRYFGMDMPRINVEDARAIPVPLPPMEEQHEITHRVQALFHLTGLIEAAVTAATERADKLSQTIFARAFRGELVPTEAELALAEGREYEPATVSLERVRAEKESSDEGRRRRSRVTSAEPTQHRIERGKCVLDILLLLDAWKKPVSILALEPALVLMRNDAARQTLLAGKATKRQRKALQKSPRFVTGLDAIYAALERQKAIRRVGRHALELMNVKALSGATKQDRARAAEVIRAIQKLADVRNLPAAVAAVTNERYEVTIQ